MLVASGSSSMAGGFTGPPIADHRPLVLRYDRFYVDRTFWKSNYSAGAGVRAFGSASTIACHLFKQQFALQVICHERMDDLQTEAAALFRGEVGGQPQTVVQQRYAHFIPQIFQRNANFAVIPVPQSVFHCVHQQFVDHERGRQWPGWQGGGCSAPPLRSLHAARVDRNLLGLSQDALAYVADVDRAVFILAQVFVNHRHAQDAVDRGGQLLSSFPALAPPALNAQDSGNGLQIVFDPVMHFLDYRRFDVEFALALHRLRGIMHEH